MASSNIDLTSPEPSTRSIRSTSTTRSQSTSIPNAFNRLMGKQNPNPGELRDTCLRPTPVYNEDYNPYVVPRKDLPTQYNPYAFKQPLYDDRPGIVAHLPLNCTLAPPTKRPRTSWVWRVGYAINDSSKSQKTILMWHCKLCMY